MTDFGLLEPGAHRVAGLADDAAFVTAMARVETAWFRALTEQGAATPEQYDAVAAAAATWQPDLAGLATQAELGGNPVLPFVRGLRDVVGEQDSSAAVLLHRGLTSQDVLDTALMLLAADTLARIHEDLTSVARGLGRLAEEHHGSVMAGRTLTQHATPITFGLKVAQWLAGVLDALERLEHTDLPVQCGGAAGTLALAGELVPKPLAAASTFARELRLSWPGMPWHTRRSPVTAVGDALVAVCDALGVIATDVALLSRPEIAELAEGGTGGASSTMPHKRNPVLSVLVRSASLQAPMLGAQLHLAAGSAVDERPDGAWHSEWPSLRRLFVLAATAAAQSADLVRDLRVDAEAMRRRADAASDALLAERGSGAEPASYLGSADVFVDRALSRLVAWEKSRG